MDGVPTGHIREQGYMSNPELIKNGKRFATVSNDKCQPDLIKFMPRVIVWNCTSKKSNCGTSSELSMCSPIILSLGPGLFPVWHVFMAKLPEISAESGSGPYMQLTPKWMQTELLACLWRLIGIYVLFGELALEIWLPCIVSMMCFSVHACVKGACLLLFIEKSLLDIAYAAFLWSCWWKMLYKQGWIGLDSVSLRACQQFIAVWLQWPRTSTAASEWAQLLAALLWLCLLY